MSQTQLIKVTPDPFTRMALSIFGDDFFREMFDEFPVKGFKRVIRRPHDLVNIKDKDGNVIGQRLSLVYTPFSKDQVKVTVNDDSLVVSIGDETKEEKTDDSGDIIYKGISTQSSKFSLKLIDLVDKEAIKAKTKEGVLHIDLPFKKKEEKKPKSIEVSIE